MKSEPALIMGAISAIIALAVGFGLHWSVEQVTLVNTAVAAIVAVVVRSYVSPTPSDPK